MVVVDSKKIARAIQASEPIQGAPARATRRTAPIAKTSARAKPDTTSSELSLARANEQTASTAVASAPDPESNPGAMPNEDSAPVDPVLFTIRQLGRTLDDIERLRIMNGNRVGAGQREGIELPWMDTISRQLDALEHSVELELKRAWRKHRLAAWAKEIPGAGEVLMGRLIAEIGNPADRPNPGKLLAYCGHGDPARAGQVPKGATQEELFKRGNPAAKKAVWKLAYQFMRTVGTQATVGTESIEHAPASDAPASATRSTEPKPEAPRRAPRSPYRDLYEQRKAQTEGKLHEKPCKRCGPSGHPAPAGSPWSDAHRHADALRIVGKRFLIDLWEADRARA